MAKINKDPKYKDILFEVKEQVAWVTINRPHTLNACRELTLDEITSAVLSTRDDPSIACVVITGAGDRAFCSGGDFASMKRLNWIAVAHPNALIPVRAGYPVEAFHGREIAAGAEGPVTCSCDHHTSDRRIVSGRENGAGDLVKRQFTTGVEGVWSIDGYPCDLLFHFEEDVFVFRVFIDFGHCRKSTL